MRGVLRPGPLARWGIPLAVVLALGVPTASASATAPAAATAAASATAPVAASAAPSVTAPAAATPSSQLPPAFSTAGFPFAVASESVVAVPDGARVRVDELVVGQSQSRRTIPDLALPLPAGAAQVRLEQGAAPARFHVSGGRADLGPVAAGAVVRAALSYSVPERNGVFWLPVGYPTVYLFVLVPHGRWRVLTPGFARHGGDRVGPLDLDAYVTATPTAGADLPVRLVRSPRLPWRVLGVAAAGAALAAVAWGRRRRTPVGSEAATTRADEPEEARVRG